MVTKKENGGYEMNIQCDGDDSTVVHKTPDYSV